MFDTQMINVTIDRGRHTILVVDDNPTTLYSTTRVLRAGGFQTAEARTGADAIAMVQSGISAVVLDVHLPDTNGFDVCRIIRAQPETALLPIMHLSAAFITDEDRVTGLNAGADAYLVHPVEAAVLIATLQALIRARTAEDSQRRTEKRLQSIFDHAPTGIALLDLDGNFTDVNPGMLHLLGRTRPDVLGRTLSDFAAPPLALPSASDRPAFNDPEATAGAGRDIALAKPDGSLVYVKWNEAPHTDPQTRIGIAVDVTQRVVLDMRLHELLEREQEARSAAEQAGRTQDEFLAVMSHELKHPLNLIHVNAELLTRLPEARALPSVVRAGSAIRRAAASQAKIIDDLLDLSRTKTGKLALHVAPVRVNETLAAIVNAANTDASSHQVSLVWQPCDQTLVIECDQVRFEQIAWNLISNAIKFSEPGGVVHVAVTMHGDRAVLSVSDKGRGIEAEFLPHVFDMFSQETKRRGPNDRGLGIGLALVRQLVEAHGGTVRAQSDGPGRGATFTVAMPLMAESNDFALSATAEDPLNPLEGQRVLLVDDSRDTLGVFAELLELEDALVTVASSGAEALALFQEGAFDILISDIGMPEMNGYQLIEQIRRRPGGQAIKAVALTGYGREVDVERALASGFAAHVSKPVSIQSLKDKLASI